MNSNFKPDFGIFFKEQFGEQVSNHFYAVKIFEISLVGHNLYSFTSNVEYLGREYAASFDFTTGNLKAIINQLVNKELAKFLSDSLLKPFTQPVKVDLTSTPIQVDITAVLGQPVSSKDEVFIPFIIEEIKNIGQNV
ncbi:MAG: hypothetical protein B6D44_10195 [Ignavibacteriales bacterium UTCHB2]|nr:MAG: hypothetical protein B6D44_10195 [Ignavibacteriales bacterium UTCHB2]